MSLHSFEGQMLTIAQIQTFVPVLSIHAVRKQVTKGHTTKAQMLGYDPSAAARKGGKVTARSKRGRGWGFA